MGIRFYDRRDAEDAMDALDGKEFEGRDLRIQMAKYDRNSVRKVGGGGLGVDLEVEVEDVPIPDPIVETEDEETHEAQREEGLGQKTVLDQDLIQSLDQDREIE